MLNVAVILWNFVLLGLMLAERPPVAGTRLLLVAVVLATAGWSGSVLLGVFASSKLLASRWFESGAVLSVLAPSLLLNSFAWEWRPSRWLPLIYVPAALFSIFVGQTLRFPFVSPLGWLAAAGPFAPALGGCLLVLYVTITLLVILRPPAWPAPNVLRVVVPALLLPLLAKDVGPLLARGAWYLPWTSVWLTTVSTALTLRRSAAVKPPAAPVDTRSGELSSDQVRC